VLRQTQNSHGSSSPQKRADNSARPSRRCELINLRPCIGIISRQAVASRTKIDIRIVTALVRAAAVPRFARPRHVSVLSYGLTYFLCGGESCRVPRDEWALFKGSREQSYRCAHPRNGSRAVSRGMVGYVARWHRSNDISITTPTALASNILFARRRANLDNRCVRRERSIISASFRILRAVPIAWRENDETHLLARNSREKGVQRCECIYRAFRPYDLWLCIMHRA